MSSGQGTLYTTSTPVMSADPYDTISVEKISPISCPDQIFHQFRQNRMCLSYCQQFRTQVKITGREITNLRRCHQCNTLENTPQNSSEQITTPDQQTETKIFCYKYALIRSHQLQAARMG